MTTKADFAEAVWTRVPPAPLRSHCWMLSLADPGRPDRGRRGVDGDAETATELPASSASS